MPGDRAKHGGPIRWCRQGLERMPRHHHRAKPPPEVKLLSPRVHPCHSAAPVTGTRDVRHRPRRIDADRLNPPRRQCRCKQSRSAPEIEHRPRGINQPRKPVEIRRPWLIPVVKLRECRGIVEGILHRGLSLQIAEGLDNPQHFWHVGPELGIRERKMGIFLRWLGAFVLLAVTFNPTPWNYVKWVAANWAAQTPLALFLGLLLGIGFMIYAVATLRSIGPFGVLLIAAVFGTGLWVLIDWGVLALDNSSLNTWLGLFGLSVILGVGLSWSILRQRLSGQASVDELEG